MATLEMDYEQNNASVLFDGFSQDSLNVSEITTIITHSMQISLDTSRMKRTIQVYCSRNRSCIAEIDQLYKTSKSNRPNSVF
jgi:cell division septum initiation protein DivIVA